jgi:hypothetical protein
MTVYYYTGHDVDDLDRQELVEMIVWLRRACIQVLFGWFTMILLLVGCLLRG